MNGYYDIIYSLESRINYLEGLIGIGGSSIIQNTPIDKSLKELQVEYALDPKKFNFFGYIGLTLNDSLNQKILKELMMMPIEGTYSSFDHGRILYVVLKLSELSKGKPVKISVGSIATIVLLKDSIANKILKELEGLGYIKIVRSNHGAHSYLFNLKSI